MKVIKTSKSPYLFHPKKKKKKRKSQKRNRPNKIRRHKYNNLRMTYLDSKFSPLMLNDKTTTAISYRIKRSLRWCHCEYKYSTVLPLFYIDPNGFVTRKVFAYWDTDFRNIISSTISTIFDRLIRRFRSIKNERFCYDHWMELVAIATIYHFSHNNIHILNRSIYLLKTKRFPDLRYFLSDRVKRLDNNTRFVCCLALKQADWLSSRARKTARKSLTEFWKFPYFDYRKFGIPKHNYRNDLFISPLFSDYIKKNMITVDLGLQDVDLD